MSASPSSTLPQALRPAALRVAGLILFILLSAALYLFVQVEHPYVQHPVRRAPPAAVLALLLYPVFVLAIYYQTKRAHPAAMALRDSVAAEHRELGTMLACVLGVAVNVTKLLYD